MKSELGTRALTPWLQSYLQDTVKDRMAETNVDCDELSRRTGVDPRKIARALKSYKPSLGLLEALVRALDGKLEVDIMVRWRPTRREDC